MSFNSLPPVLDSSDHSEASMSSSFAIPATGVGLGTLPCATNVVLDFFVDSEDHTVTMRTLINTRSSVPPAEQSGLKLKAPNICVFGGRESAWVMW